MDLKQLSKKCGKSVLFVMTVQKKYSLPVGKKYSDGYAVLVSKLIWLQLASVSQKDIQTQLTRERKLLELLKADSHTSTPTWFEDLCKEKWGPGHLLISGFSLGHASGVQTGLDFSERESELFDSSEMGDDALRALALCMESQEAILARLRQEIPVLSSALKWSRKVSGHTSGSSSWKTAKNSP
ncbi:MAG: hypothetical protein ISR85_07420 [Kiritimatiellales bacterium]|nr:hypothetical protein [Kiritimatiellales bacterium]